MADQGCATALRALFALSCLVVTGFCATCPCEEASLCLPIKVQPDKEIFIFSLTNSSDVWLKYNWSLVTTVVTVGFHNDQLMCLAHKHGARIVNIANYSPVSALANSTVRLMWIQSQVEFIQEHFLDGLNFDFESEIPEDRKEYRDGYTSLVRETNQALKHLNPYSQVTVDVAWSPANIDDRCYDYAGLADASDFLFVMSYDERSEIFGPCVAAANSALQTTLKGVQLYIQETKIKPSQLVLGVPWYGYDYPCLKLWQNNTCVIPYHPWRGVNCSDAAGRQYNYDIIQEMIKTSTSGRLWDKVAQSPFFNYKNSQDQLYHQVWYDDPESLRIKYKLVPMLHLRGVGMWQADTLDYSNTPQAQKQREEMWDALTDAL